MTRTVEASAKINLALVVGPALANGKHEVATVYQRVTLADTVALEPAGSLDVSGYADDTIVRRALETLARAAGVAPAWSVSLTKGIPVSAGLGGGSSDAAAALALANETLPSPLPDRDLARLAAAVGADVPFFLARGPRLGTGDGSDLAPLDLPLDYAVLLLLPEGAEKESTGAVYRAFDERDGAAGFAGRRRALLDALAAVERGRDLAALPRNDLAASAFTSRLVELGAFRADVSGAGPAVYGLFDDERAAESAARALAGSGRTFVTAPCW